MNETFFVSTPIYYVNARPHLGHAYTSIVADAVARFQRLMGKDAFMLTGTDEHGEKIVQTAEKEGISPQELTDRVSAEFQAILPRLGVEPARFVRTTDVRHQATVQRFLQEVYDRGDIYFGEYGGHYCYGCERFYTEKELENGLCPQHRVAPTYISEKNYFFRMSKYQDWLKRHILAHPDFIRPERYRSEVLALLDSGALEDLCISRPKTRLEWGIELPFDKDYVCYVWFDALVNYISALDWPDGADFARYWPSAQHVIAKDILKPHAIFWPTMLKAAGLEPYKHLNVHGYWLVRDTKMSKSLGNVVDPIRIIDTYGLDVFRYFLLREMHFGSDGGFSEEALIARQNADLANDLGNLFSRVLSMAAKYCASQVPAPGAYGPEEIRLQSLAENALRNYQTLFDCFRFSAALESLWELVRALNKYVDGAAPWALHKQGKSQELATVMYTLLECQRKIALHLLPVMPGAAEKMLEQLGQNPEATGRLQDELGTFGLLRAGTPLAVSSNLFPRLERPRAASPAGEPEADAPDVNVIGAAKKGAEPKKSEEKRAASAGAPPAAPDNAGRRIEFGDFQKLDLRVGRILKAEKHPDADKLLCFSVDLGEEKPRSIVSGIAMHYRPEDLAGKQVVVLANLPPRKIRGVTSEGMILTAGEDDTGLSVLTTLAEVRPGDRIS